MIIALGFKVDNERAIQFRKWANEIVKEYTIKGFAMDDERLKNSGSILTEKYFDELNSYGFDFDYDILELNKLRTLYYGKEMHIKNQNG